MYTVLNCKQYSSIHTLARPGVGRDSGVCVLLYDLLRASTAVHAHVHVHTVVARSSAAQLAHGPVSAGMAVNRARLSLGRLRVIRQYRY